MDRSRVENLRREKAEVFERMERERRIRGRMEEFESPKDLWMR